MASADLMHVDFLQPDSQDSRKPELFILRCRTGAQGKSRRLLGCRTGDAQSHRLPGRRATTTSEPRDVAGVDPRKPILINWEGPLSVAQAPDEPLRPESDRDAVVRLAATGEKPCPPRDRRRLDRSRPRRLPGRAGVRLAGRDEGRPVRMGDAKGKSLLITPQLRLRYGRRPGHAPRPLVGQDRAPRRRRAGGAGAAWKDRAQAIFSKSSEPTLSSLTLEGGVDVKNRLIKTFKASTLSLDFHPPKEKGASPELRQITAAGDVEFEKEAAKTQSIKASNLKVFLEDGKEPRHIEADGRVVLRDDNEGVRMQANTLVADLLPPGGKASGAQLAGLEQVIATGAVQIEQPMARAKCRG